MMLKHSFDANKSDKRTGQIYEILKVFTFSVYQFPRNCNCNQMSHISVYLGL
jgi:hypothetical protein